MQRFFIIDGYALLYRSYFAMLKKPTMTSYGFNTSALYGFIKTLFTVLDLWHPDFITVVFDTKVKTWRHEQFSGYKATRPKQPQVITDSLPHLKDILSAMNIKFYEKEGFEADDLAGTMTKMIPDDIKVYLMTQDKDYAQIVKKNVFLFKSVLGHGYKEIGVDEVLSSYDIDNPEQIIDFLAIVGDTADNIPGVYGVGPKIANNLLKQYHSVENIILNKEKLPEKIKNNINAEQLLRSKKLATIITDVDFKFDYIDCKTKKFDNKTLIQIFNKLEFKSFTSKINAKQDKNNQLDLF